MASFTYPGVYIEELSSGQHTITGVATSIAAFAGWAPQGPVTAATLVQSWSEYQTLFGGLDSRSWLGYAVNQFFANGGDQCYIIRLVWDGTMSGANSPVACATALASGVGYGSATISAAISGTYGTVTGTLALGVGTPVLQNVTVLPQGLTAAAQLPPLPFGGSLALAATGSFSDGSTSAPASVNWATSDPSVLTVSPAGVVTAGSTAGTATVMANAGILVGSMAITVTAASISSINVTPVSVAAVVGQSVQMAATAKYSDGSAPDVTGIATFSCADGSVTFTSTATTPLAPGQFMALTADDVPVAITAWSITSNVATFTAANTLAAGDVVSLSGFPTSTFFNGAVVTVASSSGTGFTANFTHANGSATEAGVGNPGTTISAALPSIWTLPAAPQPVPAFLGVTAATVSTLAISPANATVPLPANLEAGETEPLGFTVAATLSNGTPGPSPLATWSSSNPAVATVVDTAIAITGWSISSNVATFTAANTLAAGEAVTLSGFLTSTFFNGEEVTVLATGLSATEFEADFVHADASASETGVATPNLGAVTVTGVGTTTITASYTPSGSSSQISESTTFTVSPGHLTGLNVSPQTLTLAGGLTQQLTVTGTFDNGTFVNMTGYAAWSSSNTAYATVSPTGLVTAAKGITANQPVTIEAAWMGIDATAALTVTPPIPESLAITTVPAGTTSIAAGQNLSLVATATLSDGTTAVVTGTAAWTSSAPSLASIAGPGVVAAAATAGGSLTLFASSPGIWGNTLRVSITPLPANPSRFSLLVQQVGSSGQLTTLESYVNLSVLPTDSSYVVTVINNDSNYITFTNPLTSANVAPTAAPAATSAPVAFTGGLDGTVLVPATDLNFELALMSASNPGAGINLLDRVDIFNLLCVPGETDAPTISQLQAYCAKYRAFMIVDSPQYATISGLIQSGPVGSTNGSITGDNAPSSAFYFPWIQAPDPLAGNRPTLFPPCGFVAGIYAATDASRGVWKAPAGIDASFTGNSGLQYVLTDLENGSLNTQAVNCHRQFKVYGDVVWGARTLAGNDQAGSQWKYVPIRRLALFLESSLYDGTQWVVFEPNDETLWGQVRLNVGTFMQGLFLQGAFAGTTPAQAYFVKCDSENNPPSSIALGVVNILVGFAPLYPAEFVVIQIQQIAAQAS
jgi:phage tail sheath protein FI